MGELSNTERNAMGDAWAARLEAGSAVTYPTMVIRTAAQAALKTIDLQADAIAAFAAGVGTLNAPQGEASWVDYSTPPDANGLAADVVYLNRDEEIVFTGTVGTTGTPNLLLDTLTLDTGVNLDFSAAPTFTVPQVLPEP